MRSWLVIAVVVPLVGCTDLQDIAPEQCGNHVLEAGEDCDGFVNEALGPNTQCGEPATVNQCTYVCDDASGADCPQGWGCGQDGVCRRASGELERAVGSPWRFKVKEFGIGDVDGDGNADLVGSGEASLTVRYGTDSGEFPTELDIATRRPQGPPQFVKFNSDELMDVVIPIFSGIHVMLGQPDGSLLPVAYQPIAFPIPEAADLDEIRMFAIEVDSQQLTTELLILFGNGIELGEEATLPPGVTASQLVGDPARADIIPSLPGGREEFALAFEGTNRVYVYTTELVADPPPQDGFHPRPVLAQEVLLPAGHTIQRAGGGVLFAEVDGRRGLDLVIGTVGPVREHVVIAYNDGVGNLDATAAIDGEFERIELALPLAAGDFNGDGRADYVSGDAIFITDFGLLPLPGPPRTLLPFAFRVTESPWSEATTGDFNGDGRLDVAVSVDSEDGVDFYFSAGTGFFNKFRVDTPVPPFMLRAGDFDGDFVEDLVFGLTGFTDEPDQIAVMYGASSGGPTDPVSMGELDFVRGVEPVHVIIDIEGVDAIRDVLVVSDSFVAPDAPDQQAKQIAFLQGSSDRQLLAPYTLQDLADDGTGLHVPQRVIVGNFAELGDGEGGDPLDIIAVAQPQSNFGANGTDAEGTSAGPVGAFPAFYMWLLPANGTNAEISALDTRFTTLQERDFEARCGQWARGDLNRDGKDEIVGLDGSFRCYGFGASPEPKVVVADVSSGLTIQELDLTGDFRAADRLEMTDLDADGDLDLVVLFRGESRPGAGPLGGVGDPAAGSGVVVAWNVDGGLILNNLSWYDLPGVYRMFDVAPIHLIGDDLIPELIVVTDSGVYYAELNPETAQYETLVKILDNISEGRVRSGDVNGDGVDDVAFTDGIGNIDVYLGTAAPPLGGAVSDTAPIEQQEGE